MKASHKVNLKNSPNLAVVGQISRRVIRASTLVIVRALNNPSALVVLHLPPSQGIRDELTNGPKSSDQRSTFRFLPLNRTQFTARHVNRARRAG